MEIRELLGAGFLALSLCPYVASIIAFTYGIENVRSISCFVLGLIGVFFGWMLILFKVKKWKVTILLSLFVTGLLTLLTFGFCLVIAEKADFFNPHMIAGILLIFPVVVCIKWYLR